MEELEGQYWLYLSLTFQDEELKNEINNLMNKMAAERFNKVSLVMSEKKIDLFT